MSHYTETEVEVNDLDCFLDALVEASPNREFTREMIEVSDEPQNLIGFQGDTRKQKANIIIRRKNIGSLSNDVGFMLKDGKAVAFVSDYDSRTYSESWSKSWKQSYAKNVATKAAKKAGYRVKQTKVDGKIKLTCVKSW